MRSTRYSILIANRRTGVVRRVTVAPRRFAVLMLALALVPSLMVWGGWHKLHWQREAMQAELSAVRQENQSMRSATGALTAQIGSLQGALDDLSRLTPTATEQAAMTRLPHSRQGTARGGASPDAAGRAMAGRATSPDTMSVVRQMLDSLGSTLQAARPRVERRAALARATPAIWPALGGLSSGYGLRLDPFTQHSSIHPGLDLVSAYGAPVYATADGVVAGAQPHAEYGNLVSLTHGFGIETRYAHLSRFAVRSGASLRRGDVVGYVGSTGRSTGAHLHYEVWIDGRPVNPLQYLVSRDPS